MNGFKKHFDGRRNMVWAISEEELSRMALALAGVAQWGEYQPANHKVEGLIPGRGTSLGCRFGPLLGMCKRQPIVSLACSSGCVRSRLQMKWVELSAYRQHSWP